MKKLSLILVLLMILTLVPGCASQQPTQIAATTLPVYEFTSRLCQGTGLTVTRLVTESVSCLHDYSLNVTQVQAVESAQLVILSGAGLEEFMEDLLSSAETVVDSAEGIEILYGDGEHEHEHEHAHEGDPHIWLSTANAKVMAQNICDGLSAQYPSYAATFEKNLKELLVDLDVLQTYGETTLAELRCRELVTFHDGFTYFAESFDLTILEAVEEESGSEAAAQELKHLANLVTEHQLPAVFTEANGSTSAASVISRETGVETFTLDMAMAGDSYFDAMYHNIDTIKEALG